MDKFIMVDKHSFNATHYTDKTEAQFLKNELASVLDYYGDNAAKIDYLKEAWLKVNPTANDNNKPISGKIKGG